MTTPTTPKEEYTTVPYSYRARLEMIERVPTNDDPNRRRSFADSKYESHKTQTHHMQLAGRVHPKEYTVQEATALVSEKIQPLLDLGWHLKAIRVTGYNESDA